MTGIRGVFFALLLTALGCVNQPVPQASHATRDENMTSRHAAALAESLANAGSGPVSANGIEMVCNVGYSSGGVDGVVRGQKIVSVALSTHCLKVMPESFMQYLMTKSGNDPAKATEMAKQTCDRSLPERQDMYGDGLLKVTRKCEGDQLCGLIVQSTYIKCYTAGSNDAFEESLRRPANLQDLLRTCSTFKTEGTSCQQEAHQTAFQLEQSAMKGTTP